MQRFFSSLFSLEQFTFSLSAQNAQQRCLHCSQYAYWVSHGYVYKQQSSHCRKIVGKRILCSPHYGRDGCGHTRQLYLQSVVPRRHYLLPTFLAFIRAMISGCSVKLAWQVAVNDPRSEPRQAWRWLGDLMRQLGRFRTALNQPPPNAFASPHYASTRFNSLLPTLDKLLRMVSDNNALQIHLKGALC